MNQSYLSKIFNIIISKKTLYVLCFMLLNLIEVLRGSQSGDVWYVAVNCTGLVVMVIVVSGWPLRDFLTISNGIYTLACVIAMIVIGINWHPVTGRFVLWQVETAVMNAWWLGIIVKYLFTKAIVQKTLPFKPGLMGWIWIIMSIFMIVSVSQRFWPLWFLLMFASFYLTSYKPEDKKALWDAMVDGTILSFFCIQIYAYGFRPYDEVRYRGAFGNCNMTALYYLIIYMMCLYKLHFLEVKKAHRGWKLLYLFGAGGMLSFQLFTLCRTAWIASFVLTILYGIFVVKRLWGKKWRQVIYRGGALALAVALTFLPVFYSIRWLPTILHHPVWYPGEYSVRKVHSYDPPDSKKYVELDEFLEQLIGRLHSFLITAFEQDPFLMKAEAGQFEEAEQVEFIEVPWLSRSVNARLAIYRVYLKDLTFFGHSLADGYYRLGESSAISWHAQNLWIQIAYTFGIPAGILMIVLTAVMIYIYFRRMKESDAPYAIVPFFICILTFVFGITEIVWNPGQLIMFLFFFVQHPQMGTE